MKVNNIDIIEKINKEKDFINNFPMETSKGTKVMKNKFHKKAVLDRNEYVSSLIKEYSSYKESILSEINKRVNKMFPSDNNSSYKKQYDSIESLKEVFKLTNKYGNVDYRLGLTKLIYDLSDTTSTNLVDTNLKIKEIINILINAGISLSFNDFNYSGYTYLYMECFFNNVNKNNFNDIIKNKFEELYWECPGLINQIRLNFNYIVYNHQKELTIYCNKMISKKMNDNKVSSKDLFNKYNELSKKVNYSTNTDSYNLVNRFLNRELNITDYLENSTVRINNYNHFSIGEYNSLSDYEKDNYNIQINELSNTLEELTDFYLFKPIIDSLKDIYKAKSGVDKTYLSKQKEISTTEKKREKLYKKYNSSLKGNLFNKVNQKVIDKNKLLLNEEIDKLNTLYQELDDMEISYNILKNIDDTSTIYDLLLVGFSSYKYLKKIYNEVYSTDEYNISLDSLMNKLFEYLFNYTNSFIYKLSLNDSDNIVDNICSKFNLLNINISKDDLSLDNLTNTKAMVKMILIIDYISKSKISLSDIEFIYNAKNI